MRTGYLLVAIAGLLIQCNRAAKGIKQDFEYIPLKEYKYKAAIIQPETEVELLAFSGGKRSEGNDNVLYYQFIVYDRAHGDTLRILAPFIRVDETAGLEKKTFTTPLQFDPAKGITHAFYEFCDSSCNLLLQTGALIEQGKLDTAANMQSLMDRTNLKEMVVVNKSLSMFENPDYRTAIGVLNFHERPW